MTLRRSRSDPATVRATTRVAPIGADLRFGDATRDSLPPCGTLWGRDGVGGGAVWHGGATPHDPHPHPLPTRGRGGVCCTDGPYLSADEGRPYNFPAVGATLVVACCERAAEHGVKEQEGTKPMIDLADVILRLGGATLIGAAIGLNRDLRGKPIGVRTLGLVGLASAMAVVVVAPAGGDDINATSRVMQGVLTGIGFLGAGVIVRGQHRQVGSTD